MSNLLADISTDFREFWDVPLANEGVTYDKTAFDAVNASLVFERIIETESNDDLAIVMPNDPTVVPLMIVEGMLSLLKYDQLVGSKIRISDFKVGDQHIYVDQGKYRPCIFRGTRSFGDGPALLGLEMLDEHRKERKGTVQWIPSRWASRIWPYQGHEPNSALRSTRTAGNTIANLMGLPPGGLLGYQHSKALVVAHDKKALIEFLRATTLGGDPFEAIFPIADYTSEDSTPYRIGGNPLGRDALLGMTASIELAEEIALKDPSFKLILIVGASKTRNITCLQRLKRDDSQRKIVAILRPEDEEEINLLAEIQIPTWVWSRRDFRQFNQTDRLVRLPGSKPVARHTQIIAALSGNDPAIEIVGSTNDLNKNVSSAWQSLHKITKGTNADYESGLIIQSAYSIIRSLLQLPVEISSYDEYLSGVGLESLSISNRIRDLQNKIILGRGTTIPSSLTDEWEKVLASVQKFYMQLYLNNPKWDYLLRYVYDTNNSTIICNRAEIVASILGAMPPSINPHVTLINRRETEVQNNVLITSWLGRSATAFALLAPYNKVTYLFYVQEYEQYMRFLETHPSSPSRQIDADLRRNNKMLPSQPAPVEAGTDPADGIETPLEEVIVSKFGRATGFEDLGDTDRLEQHEAYRVDFENDTFAYVGVHSDLNRIDRDKGMPERCKVEKLERYDEVIFVNGSRDIFMDHLDVLKDSDSYKGLRATASIWKKALAKYMGDNNVDEEQFSESLKASGCPRGPATVRSWLDGKVIGPDTDNYSAIRAIALITGDVELSSNIEQVIASCKEIHRLHIQTGRLVIQNIVHNVLPQEEAEIDPELRRSIEKYSQNAQIVTVTDIARTSQLVPVQAVNRLISA